MDETQSSLLSNWIDNRYHPNTSNHY